MAGAGRAEDIGGSAEGPAATAPVAGIGAAVAQRRHDILAGLAALGAAGDAAVQRRVLRLILLLTARYNWQGDALSIGRAEIARLWAVDERTVRREMGRLRELGWLVLRRPAARGRVALYGLGAGAVLAATRPGWARLGPDFAARLAALAGPAPLPAGAGPQVVAFPGPRPDAAAEGPWARIRARLAAAEPDLARAWFDRLVPEPGPQGGLALRAPSAFVARYVETHLADRLVAAWAAEAPDLAPPRILAPGA
jgi:hypothetical protein